VDRIGDESTLQKAANRHPSMLEFPSGMLVSYQPHLCVSALLINFSMQLPLLVRSDSQVFGLILLLRATAGFVSREQPEAGWVPRPVSAGVLAGEGRGPGRAAAGAGGGRGRAGGQEGGPRKASGRTFFDAC
jgi:hypothetical protein